MIVYKLLKDIRQSGWGLLFLLLCCWHTAAGQLSYTFRKYTVDDGLPSANIYDLKQDAKGFLWMATESGICRFDGRMFEKEPLEALGNTEVIKLYFDRLDRLWLADLGNNILLYDQDSLRNLNLLPGFRGESYTNIFEDKSGDFWLSGALDPNVTFLEGQRLSDSTTINYNSPYFNSSKVFISINDTLQHLIGKTGVSAFRNHRMEYKAWPKRFRLKTAPQATTRIRDTILVATLDGLFSYSRIKMQLTPAFRKFREMFGGGITVMLTDRDENLWVGTRDGVILFPANQRDRPQRYLTDRFISGIVQDHEGGYWLATQKDGLFYLPGLNIKTYRNPGLVNQLTAVTTDSMGSTIIGFDNSWVNALDRDYRLRGQWKMSRQDGEIYDIIKDDRENFFFLHNRQIEKRNKLFELMYQLDGSYKSGNFLSENKLYLGTTNVALLLDTEERTRDTLLNFRTYSILPISENEIWVGTIRGLFHFYNNTFTLQENPLLQQDIRDIQIAADSTLWLATQADGLILYKNGEVIQHLTTRSGLVSNNCKKLWLEGPYAWLATNKGVHRFDQSDRSFITITRDHGLPSNEINDFAQHGNTLLCATNNGLAIFDDSLQVYAEPPRVQFTRISFKDITAPLKNDYQISYEENDINIEFSGIAYHQPNELEYQYTLEPRNDSWIQTSANLAQFQALDPGSYTFKVRARTRNSLWSPEQRIQFNISRPFWMQWWFVVGLVLAGLFILYRLFAWIYNDLRERREIKEKLQASQMTALRAQMNPHFLFNSLNSIQEFIINQDKREANRYLTRFSRLMRNILNMSEMEEVYLQQEIETLELYLSLEALRFEENFEYHFDIGKMIDTESMTIPPMLVQPYVENAVKHGLMHKKDGVRHLWVRFYVENKMLVCEVEDNGIGREKARAIQQNNQRIYESKAMEMTEQRLRLLNRAYDNTLDVKVEDLVDPAGEAAGTKVTLYISLDE